MLSEFQRQILLRLELLIRMRLHIWYYIKLKPKPSFGIHVATNCICNKSVCYNFNEFGEGVGINTHLIYSGAGILLRVKLHGCVFIAGTQRASALFASRIDIFYANNVNLIVIFILCNH
ncbi:hypothetical protein LXL04_033371 [Taraxacum kok-saghyz]